MGTPPSLLALAGALLVVAACGPSTRLPAGECRADTDCPAERPLCDTAAHGCVACRADGDCGCHEVCTAGACAPLGAADASRAASAHGNWRGAPGAAAYASLGLCVTDTSCGFGELCNPLTAGCVRAADYQDPCPQRGDCPAGPRGEVLACAPALGRCLPAPACKTGHNCCGAALACDAGAGLCRPLRGECDPPAALTSTCPAAPRLTTGCPVGSFCSTLGACIGCGCDADCSAGQRCWAATSRCVAGDHCEQATDCAAPQACDRAAQACVAACVGDGDCALREWCNPDDHVCRPRSEAPCAPDEWDTGGNDTPDAALAQAAALPVPALGAASTVDDLTLCGPTDAVDYYVVSLARGDRLIVEGASLTGLEASLRAWAGDGESPLGRGALSDLAPSPLDFTVSDDGLYFLEVARTATGPATATYSLTLRRETGQPCTDAFEVAAGTDDTPLTATDLARLSLPGCTASAHAVTCGALTSCLGDLDHYRVEVPRGGELVARITGYTGILDLLVYGPFADATAVAATPAHLAGSSTGLAPSEQRVTVASRDGGAFLVKVVNQGPVSTTYGLDVAVTPPSGSCLEDDYDAPSAAAGGPPPLPSLVVDPPGRDDTQATAAAVGLTPGQSTTLRNVAGTPLTLCGQDVDWYRVMVVDGGALADPPKGWHLRVAPGSLGPSAAVVSALASSAGGEAPHEVGSPGAGAITTGDPVFVRVAAGDPLQVVPHTLELRLDPPPTCPTDGFGDTATVTNDTPATALVLDPAVWPDVAGASHTQAGLTLCRGDQDWYRVRVPPGTELVARVSFFDPDANEVGLALYDERVTAASTAPTALIDTSASVGRGFERVAGFVSTSTAYLQVHDRAGWPVLGYDLTVSLTPAACGADTFAPSSTTSPAPLPVAVAPYRAGVDVGLADPASLCGTDVPPEDWFSLRLQPGDRVVAGLDADAGTSDLTLGLFGPAPGTGALVTPGTTLVDYTVPMTAASASYLLRAATTPGHEARYALWASVTRSCSDDVHEPARREAPFALTMPVGLEGVLCDDEDWFRLDLSALAASTPLSVCARFVHAQGDIDLELWPAGATAFMARSATKNDLEQIVTTITPGLYDVRIHLDPRDHVNTTYSLSVTQDSQVCP